MRKPNVARTQKFASAGYNQDNRTPEEISAARIDAARQWFLQVFRHEAPNVRREALFSEAASTRSAMEQIVYLAGGEMKNG